MGTRVTNCFSLPGTKGAGTWSLKTEGVLGKWKAGVGWGQSQCLPPSSPEPLWKHGFVVTLSCEPGVAPGG